MWPSPAPWPLNWLDEWAAGWHYHHPDHDEYDPEPWNLRAARLVLDLSVVVLHPRTWRTEYATGDRWPKGWWRR